MGPTPALDHVRGLALAVGVVAAEEQHVALGQRAEVLARPQLPHVHGGLVVAHAAPQVSLPGDLHLDVVDPPVTPGEHVQAHASSGGERLEALLGVQVGYLPHLYPQRGAQDLAAHLLLA